MRYIIYRVAFCSGENLRETVSFLFSVESGSMIRFE